MKKCMLMLGSLLIASVAQAQVSGPTQAELNAADTSTDSWLMYNKGYSGTRYSTLNQITTENVKDLQRVCTFDIGSLGGFQVTPQIYKGVMYITHETMTYALDATNCNKIWESKYEPTSVETLATNRGVAIYNGMLFRGTSDAHLIALDAATGKKVWDVTLQDSEDGYFHSAAPIVYNDMVFIGDAGADWGIKAKMYAFNVKDGSKAWEFDLIPTGNQAGANTWENADSTSTGGGSTWTSYSLDTSTGKIYIPVGNPAPDFAAEYRPGDNLYTNSVLVLDAKTGTVDHYYQQLPNDSKDYDTSAAPVLYTINGKLYSSVATKAGYLFTYDESTRKQVYKVPTITTLNQEVPPTKEGIAICPNYSAGSQWSGPSYMPDSQLLVVNSVDWCGTVKIGEVRYVRGQLFFAGAMALDPANRAVGYTTAFDANTGKLVWRHAVQSVRVVGGVTTTAGKLVFTGDMLGNMYAMDAASGSVVFNANIDNAPIGGGVSTYMVGDTQYVAVAAGNTSKGATGTNAVTSRVAIFALKK